MKEILLLVDDNPELLEVISDELSERYEVLTAADGEQALEVLSSQPVHLVISDVMMPVMDGFEFCRRIKSNIEFSHIPVILLTARNTLQSKIEGLELGADAYIEKPFEIEYLVAQIANLIANRRKLQAFFAQSPVAKLQNIAQTSSDEQFLVELNKVIDQHLDDPHLDIDKLATLMHVSRTSLFRKLRALSDLSPKEIINISRLKKAAQLLTAGTYKVYEVSDMVGFNSHTNFGRSFHKFYGVTPLEYQKRNQLPKGE
ncbi:response regulator [Chitinophaga horti]|uniref:Response regulator n=1 Tax=Chitinophaga horti TaxID=2920382 RepID=A0ABY6J863_9BACT|nr:response regulator [Chitinophaga horti]UYQ95883.1 response regulator [Chitinophaga horti]